MWLAQSASLKPSAVTSPSPLPVYVMPSTSGLNAHSRLDDLTAHFRAAGKLADRPGNRC